MSRTNQPWYLLTSSPLFPSKQANRQFFFNVSLKAWYFTLPCFSLPGPKMYYFKFSFLSQLRQDRRGVDGVDGAPGRLVRRVRDLAVVDDQGVPARPAVAGPADLAGELGVEIAHEQLFLTREGGTSVKNHFHKSNQIKSNRYKLPCKNSML